MKREEATRRGGRGKKDSGLGSGLVLVAAVSILLLVLVGNADASWTRFVANNRIRVVAETQDQWDIVKGLDAIVDHQPRNRPLETILYATDEQRQFLVDLGVHVEDAVEPVEEEEAEERFARGNNDDYTSDSYWKMHHNYNALTSFLQKLHQDYPDITNLFSIGQSVQGRNLWVMEISDNPGVREEGEPFFKYIGNMHGDEVFLFSFHGRHQTSDIKHQTSNIKHQTSDIKHQTSDIRHQTSNIKHQTSDIRHQTSNTNHQKKRKTKTKHK